MKLILPFFLAMAASAKREINVNSTPEASAIDETVSFWDRELQSSATSAPTPTSFFATDPPTPSPTVTPPVTPAPTATPPVTPAPTATPPVTPAPTVSSPGTATPTISPAPSFRCGIDPIDRRTQIMTILEGVSIPTLLSTTGTPQNNAAEWLIGADEFYVCPGDEKLIQRYVMGLFYYSTEGDSWTACSQGDAGCTGADTPYLAPVQECQWFGSTCNVDLCMTEIVFEANNVDGTMPFELEQLQDLEVLSLEQGGLQLDIPSNLGTLSNLRILDLDFNQITGPIPEEIYGLTNLQQLDLNSNKITGTLSTGVGNLISLQLLQVYENLMTGTIPLELGNVQTLVIGEFYNNTFTGSMPQEVCDNRTPDGNLNGLTADCFPNPIVPQIECSCCTGCAVF